MSVVAASKAMGRPGGTQSQLSRRNSRQSSSRETPASSTDGDSDDEDDEEDDEEDYEGEGEIGEAEKIRFDERFLAQLLAFDPSSSGSNGNSAPFALPSVEKDPLSTGGTGFPLMPSSEASQSNSHVRQDLHQSSVPLSAPTPSSEFYDGAINFLTEVLGSSAHSLWSGGAGLASPDGPDLNWLKQAQTPSSAIGLAAPSPQPTKSQFKDLQPLISNLIARLKGLPIQENDQTGKVLEDDLVILLQSLMAHRQAQQDRQAHRHLDQSMATLRGDTDYSTSTSTRDEPMSTSLAGHEVFGPQPGFSIVDFDFGDDDDDPDFVPNNISLDFANSAEFADALAQVSANPLDAMPTSDSRANGGSQIGGMIPANEAAWQQMMDSLQGDSLPGNGNAGNVTDAAVVNSTRDAEAGPSTEASPAGRSGFRRTRSTTRNVDLHEDGAERLTVQTMGGAQSQSPTLAPMGFAPSRDTTEEADTERPRKKGRRIMSREEALERRRESNRECARRARARKKEEEEELRQEFNRMRKLRSVSQETGTGGEEVALSKGHLDLPAGLRKKKRGRPFGSKSYDNGEEKAGEKRDVDEKVADLRADNRMLRAEMQRLIEENAQLRATMLRYQEDGTRGPRSSSYGRRSGSKRTEALRGHRQQTSEDGDYTDQSSPGGEELLSDEVEGDKRFMTKSLASRGLAYDPFKAFHVRPPLAQRTSSEQKNDIKSVRRRHEGGDQDSKSGEASKQKAIEELLQGLAANQQQASSSSLQDLIQAAAGKLSASGLL